MNNELTFDEFCVKMRNTTGYNAFNIKERTVLEEDYKNYLSFIDRRENNTPNELEVDEPPKKYKVGERIRLKEGHHRGLSGTVKEIYDDYMILGIGNIGANVKVIL